MTDFFKKERDYYTLEKTSPWSGSDGRRTGTTELDRRAHYQSWAPRSLANSLRLLLQSDFDPFFLALLILIRDKSF